jgi:hypothetical protein
MINKFGYQFSKAVPGEISWLLDTIRKLIGPMKEKSKPPWIKP